MLIRYIKERRLIMRKVMMVISVVVAIFVAVAGCQSVGGYDVNEALMSNLVVNSYEGSSSLTIELLWDETQVLDEELAGLQLLKNIKINIHDLKMEDTYTMSMKGTFHFSKGEIPFQMTM